MMGYPKKQEHVAHLQEQKQAMETTCERADMLDLTEKVFKPANINMF